jgi:hypothetical protein
MQDLMQGNCKKSMQELYISEFKANWLSLLEEVSQGLQFGSPAVEKQ